MKVNLRRCGLILFVLLVAVIAKGQAVTVLDSIYCRLQTALETACNFQNAKQSQEAEDVLLPLIPQFEGRNELQFRRMLGEYNFWLGYSAFYLNDHEAAKHALLAADSIVFAIDGSGSELRARIRRLEGTVAYFIDENAFKAQNFYNEAYQEWTQINGKDSVEYAVVLQCMGQAAGRLGEYEQSVDLYKQSLAIREAYYGKTHWRVGWTHWNLGNTHFYARNYPAARIEYELALDVLHQTTPGDLNTIGNITNNLAITNYWLGQYNESSEQYGNAIKIMRVSKGMQALEIAIAYSNWAMVWAKKGDFGKANEALKIASSIYNANHLKQGINLAKHELNEAYVSVAEYGPCPASYALSQNAMKAIAPSTNLENVLSFPSSSETDEPVLLQEIALFKAGLLQEESRHSPHRQELLEASMKGYELVANLSDRLRMQYEDRDDKLLLSDRGTKYLRDALTVAHELWELTGKSEYLDLAFKFTERNKFQLLLEFFRKSQMQVAGELPELSLNNLDSLRMRCAELDFLLSIPNLSADSQAICRTQLLENRQSLNRLEDSLQQESRLFRAVYVEQTTISLDSLQHTLQDSRLAAISYALTDSILFVISAHGGEATFRKTYLPLHFQDSIQVWLNLCRNVGMEDGSMDQFTRLGRLLYTLLLQPELEKFRQGVTRLLIIPDGVLGNVPFEALVTKPVAQGVHNYAALPFLIRDYQIHYGGSASLWSAQRNIQLPDESIECLGIAWGETPGEKLPGFSTNLPSLKGTSTELEAIAAIVQGRYLKEEEATEAAFKQFAPQFGMLHLALHARAMGDPEILFPHGGSQNEDGILHFHELFQLRLKSRIAVLSACETAVGEIKVGEGIQSMSSGFAAAGIPTLLVSLWQLDDQSGAKIMEQFYHGLEDGLEVDDALRRAKLNYLDNATGFEASPFYWSTFVPIGNMKPIPIKQASGDYRWSIATGLGLFLCIFLIYRIYKKKQKST